MMDSDDKLFAIIIVAGVILGITLFVCMAISIPQEEAAKATIRVEVEKTEQLRLEIEIEKLKLQKEKDEVRHKLEDRE